MSQRWLYLDWRKISGWTGVFSINIQIISKLLHKHNMGVELLVDMLYSHIIKMHIYPYTCRIHIDTIKTSKDFFKKIYLSLYLKGLYVWERELETEQRLQHIDLPSPSGHSYVSFSFPGLLNRMPAGPLCWELAFSTISCHRSRVCCLRSKMLKSP